MEVILLIQLVLVCFGKVFGKQFLLWVKSQIVIGSLPGTIELRALVNVATLAACDGVAVLD